MKKSIIFPFAICFALVACKKEVKPEETQAIASAAPAVSVPAPPTDLPDVGAELFDSGAAPLASLEPAKKPAPTATGKPKADPPECIQARVTCANPSAGVNARLKKLCDDQKAACTKAGGKV